MQIEVHNPSGFDTATMATKFIRAMYETSLEEFVTQLVKEQERKEAES